LSVFSARLINEKKAQQQAVKMIGTGFVLSGSFLFHPEAESYGFSAW